MNLQAKDLIDTTANLISKVQEGVNISDILQGIKIPQLDDLSQLLQTVLPQNLTQFNVEGVLELLNPLEFQDKIKQGIDSMQGLIEGQIKSVIDEVTNTVQQVEDITEQAVDTVEQISSTLTSGNLNIFDSALEAVSKINNYTVDIPVISKFSQTIATATDSIKNLSPKQIRDLADPEYYNQVVSETLNTANQLLEQDIIDTAKQFVQVPPSIESVSSLFASANTALGGLGPTSSGEPYVVEATVTTYFAKGEGADIDAFNNKTSTGKKLQSGKSCAVDNINILYNSKVTVPGVGTFTAVDRLRGGSSTIMLYYETKEQADSVSKKLTGKIPVTVKPPGGGGILEKILPQSRGNEAKII